MIAIISGTNRNNSISLLVSKQIKKMLIDLHQEVLLVNLQELPDDLIESSLYSNSGKNHKFNQLSDKIKEADKLFFVIPEYNGSFPGVLKTFIDGLPYPSVVKGKKAAILGISSGVMGSALAISHFTDILNYLGCSVLATKPRITSIEKNFINNSFVDPFHNNLINSQLSEFLNF